MPRPREELEVRLTALLLGELTAQEAADLREIIAKDTHLAGLHDRLKRAIDLVREAAATGTEPATAQAAPLKLSAERRQKLFAHFKTVAPKEFIARPRLREWSWLVPLSAAAAAIMLLAAVTIPNFTLARKSTLANSVLNNLRILEGAKDQWALENNNGITPAEPQSGGVSSATVVAYSSTPSHEEKRVAAKPLAPSANRPSSSQIFRYSLDTQSVPPTDRSKPEVE